MFKMVLMLNSDDLPNELPAFERFYLRYHAPEVIAQDGPMILRFIAYRPLPVIPEALAYGYYNERVTEIWFRSVDDFKRTPGVMFKSQPGPRKSFTFQAPWANKPVVWEAGIRPRVGLNVITPSPDNFLSGKYTTDEKTYIRWYTVTKYPQGVSLEEGEDWFLNVHAKEVVQQPRLMKYFSSRAVEVPGHTPNTWVRLTEMWYEDFHSWKKSVIDSQPKYTRPSWAKYDKYPFLEPYVDFASTFLMERPDHDYLKEAAPYP
jgi:hypothetical protein